MNPRNYTRKLSRRLRVVKLNGVWKVIRKEKTNASNR
ncbi:hypothetical protein NVP1084O_087 [Vibrio phage 1.084.O._10N.261.49.F5]|nr:hypothetical protein NVP1084O_087 [Vibrio phage 1.084.O._10N.261.49.F5]